MVQKELIDSLAVKMGVTKKFAKESLDAIINGIEDALKSDGEIKIAKFGKFTVKTVAAREGRNPSNGEVIQIAEKRKVYFSPASALKELVK